jgi:hypothetical protein
MDIYIVSMSMIEHQNRAHKRPHVEYLRAFYAVALALGILVLGSCSYNPILDPKPIMLEDHVDYGPPEYRQGYEDGCHSALGAYGTSMMKTVYHMTKTPKYTTNKMYNQVWKDSWNYCYMWLFVYKRQGDLL